MCLTGKLCHHKTFVMTWPDYGYGKNMDDGYGSYTIAGSTLKLSDGKDGNLFLNIQDGLILLDEESADYVVRYKKN